MKQLEVPIMGQAYVLACPDGSEERMIEAVQRVDSAMCKIRDAGKIRARDRIAVLAALNMAFDLIEKEQQIAALPCPLPQPKAKRRRPNWCTPACRPCCSAWTKPLPRTAG